jgi:aminobenzoyl-glutamate utilization protein B
MMQTGLQWIEHNTPDLVTLAQAAWEHAEVSLQERKSAAEQAAYLKQEGFNVQLGLAGMPTALAATFGDGKPVIGFLGEYDALPGVSQTAKPHQEPLVAGGPGHGCGHNLLGVGSLAAAVALKREMQASGIKGTVRYYGCPAEETVIGKVFMAKHGVFNDLDAAITWHPSSLNVATMSSCLANNSARFAFYGRTAHAAGDPHMGISALDAVELMDVGVNYLREHVIQEARLHYVITHGGGQPNVVPAFAEVWYFVRAPHRRDVEEIYQRVVKIAEGAALMTGARLEIKFQTGVYEYLANPVVTDLMQECLQTVGAPVFTAEEKAFALEMEKSFAPGQRESLMRNGEVPEEYWDVSLHEGVAPIFDKGKVMKGSTDVGDVSWIAPTGQLGTACHVNGSTGHSWMITACSGMSIGHKGMLVAAKAMALAGYRLMTEPALLAQANAAFIKDTGGKPYVSPLPPDLLIPSPQLEEK